MSTLKSDLWKCLWWSATGLFDVHAKPLILGEPGTIAAEDQAAVAMWAQKTVITAMLVSSEKQGAGGYGLPLAEYQALYAGREQVRPLDATQF